MLSDWHSAALQASRKCGRWADRNMNIEVTPKIKQEFNKNWKKLTSDSGYLVPETIDDFKSLGPFPYFRIENIWVYPKEHTSGTIRHFVIFFHGIVGEKLFTRETVYEAIRDEIKLYFKSQEKHSKEWHLEHLIDSIFSKNKKRLFIRSIRGITLENFEGIRRKVWQLILFKEDEIEKFNAYESVDENWKSHVKEHLTKNYKDKVCLVVECEGDFKTARKKAKKIMAFVVNTLRYFICIHIANTGRVHDVGIKLDTPNINNRMNAFSFDLESKSSTMFGYGEKFRHVYPLSQEHFSTIKKEWGAEILWDMNEKEDLNDLESSIISSIAWLGDAHQEEDINSSYVKYWIAIEALLTGHKKSKDLATRIKNTIPVILSQFAQELPTKTAVDKAYELRSKVVHCGSQGIIQLTDLNKICSWATQCLSVCIHLLNRGYTSRDQIEIQINRINKGLQKGPTKVST